MIKKFIKVAAALACAVAVSAVHAWPFSSTQSEPSMDKPLRVIASSELRDMESILSKANLGFKIEIEYSSTLDAVDKIANSNGYDVSWLPQNKYFASTPAAAKKVLLQEKTMTSPTVIGVNAEVYNKYFAAKKNISWADVASIVNANRLPYAMTDPSSSNTGYSALLALAYSVSNKGENLTANDIDTAVLSKFFENLKVQSNSSGQLASEYFALTKGEAVMMVNYESVILSHNAKNPSKEMKIIYPHEGIITSDYPMSLLTKDSAKKEQFYKLTSFLRSQSTQESIVAQTYRRPLNNAVRAAVSGKFYTGLMVEVPFDFSPEVSSEILSSYYNKLKAPAAFAFVLDTSGSMNGKRWTDMMGAMNEILTPGKFNFSSIRSREQFFLIPFSNEVWAQGLEFFDANGPAGNLSLVSQRAKARLNTYSPGGGTALFTAAANGVQQLQNLRARNAGDKKLGYNYSVIVLTDGEANEGASKDEFVAWYKKQAPGIKVHTILFGDAVPEQLKAMTDASGGKVFDARSKSLTSVFKEIRAIQ